MGEVKSNWLNMESGWVINCYRTRHWRRMTILLKSKESREGLIPFQLANNPSISEHWQETGSWTKNRELKLNPRRMKHWWERFWRIKRYCSCFPLAYYLLSFHQFNGKTMWYHFPKISPFLCHLLWNLALLSQTKSSPEIHKYRPPDSITLILVSCTKVSNYSQAWRHLTQVQDPIWLLVFSLTSKKLMD